MSENHFITVLLTDECTVRSSRVDSLHYVAGKWSTIEQALSLTEKRTSGVSGHNNGSTIISCPSLHMVRTPSKSNSLPFVNFPLLLTRAVN